MRHYQTLDTVTFNAESGIFAVSAAGAAIDAKIALRREGEFVALSASYGPLEIALRPRYAELVRTLARLRPIGGLQTSRELGSTQAYISLGLNGDDALLLRPTIVGDASGHVGLNFSMTADARKELYTWLGVTAE